MVDNILKTDPTLSEMVSRLIAEFTPKLIYLFGSMARRDGGEDSDYDLMLVVADSSEPRYRRSIRAHRALWGIWKGADVIVLTEKEFNIEKPFPCSLPATIIREGLKLYAAQ